MNKFAIKFAKQGAWDMFDRNHMEPDLKNKTKNGGFTMDGYGAICVRKPKHPFNNNGYVRLNRLVMEYHLQRYLKPDESVIAIDGNYENVEVGNLKLVHRNGLDTSGISYYTKNKDKRNHRFYIYKDNTGNLFGVEKEMAGYNYPLVSLGEVMRENWLNREDAGNVYILKEGAFLYEGGQFKLI